MIEAQEKTMTLDEFLAFIERQPDDSVTSYELHQGVLAEVSHSKATQTAIAAELITYVRVFVRENKLGIVASSDGDFKIPPDDFYAPDMAYYSKTRVPKIPEDDYYAVAPDLAAEVVSTSDQYSARGKVLRYLELGTRMAWVVYPKRKTIDVYRPTEDGVSIRKLTIDDMLDGEDVLPGFTLPVRNVFDL